MKKQKYDLKTLEQYVQSKMDGHVDKDMEQAISKDSFLTYIVAGLETHLSKQRKGNLNNFLQQKQDNIWQSIERSFAVNAYDNKISSSVIERTFSKAIRYLKGEFDVHSYHYLVGFNCCCLLVLVLMCVWVGFADGAVNINADLGGVFDSKQ